jgi:hypothetical protein
MVFPESTATGTVIHPSLLKKYCVEAGFSKVEAFHQYKKWRFYAVSL